MKKISSRKAQEYQFNQFGTWGRFGTSAGIVEYLETKARVGAQARDREKRLTSQLRPVREVLPSQSMSFNQLLQRDLDDHRVATGLVPYILQASRLGPAFFPPIVAALLPFNGSVPIPRFPDCETIEGYEDDFATWGGMSYGSAFKFERMLDQLHPPIDHEIKVGRLSWNPEEAKLVVIDGQHRAMALLAIDRTINNTWNESGEKYKYFYEPVIRELLKNKSDEERQQLLAALEFPVTIVWFPDANESRSDHHVSARKLFVDVNQNARAPTESRLLLLSDGELLSIFTREVLNTFRQNQGGLPIFAIEYDHPGRDQASSSKWSAISNVIIIRDCISRAVFGPDKYITNVAQGFGGKESESGRAEFMRKSLEIGSEIGETVEDLRREQISNIDFPRSKLDFFVSQLMNGWGRFVVRVLSEVLPYQVHGQSLGILYDNWATAGSTDALARDALFEGVGMYWTIRDSQRHWANINQLRLEAKQQPLEKTDIVRTWDAINQKREEFTRLRAKNYVGKNDDQSTLMCDEAFDVFGTNACQLGLTLTARTLAYSNQVDLKDLPAFTDAFISAINASLQGGPKQAFGRRAVFNRSQESRLNEISKLDTPYAVYFRYFWLELLATPESLQILSTVIPAASITKARDDARTFYFVYLVKEMTKALRRASTGTKASSELQKEAESQVSTSLFAALSKWFGIRRADFDAWQRGAQETKRDIETASQAESNDSSDASNESSDSDQSDVSFDDLLGKKLDEE